jgi:GntR family galactonate operon transcriptional repressor
VFVDSPFDAFVDKRGSTRRRGMIVHEMGRLIVDGTYAAGTTLPGGDELIAKLSVSRTPFWEAMKTLAAKALVEIRTKTGTRVREPADWHHTDPGVMVWHYGAGPSREFLDSLADLRRVLEPAAAAPAAGRATKADIVRITKAYRGTCDTIGDPKVHSEADRDFPGDP